MKRGRPSRASIRDRRFSTVVDAFMSSPQWHGYSPATRDCWGRELLLASKPETLGALSVFVIRPALVQAFIDGLSGRKGKQAAALAALKQVERWAIVRDLLAGPITLGVDHDRSHEGHRPWTDEQVRLAELRARPDLARAITLAVNTGQRGSDLVRIGWADVETYNGRAGFQIKQQKTGKELWVPITRELDAAMTTWERRPGPILRRPSGIAWTRKALTWAWICERNGNAALAPLAGMVLHGLRATACVRLRQAGANMAQIADMVGMSEPMVARYCRFSLQRENAGAAVIYLDRTKADLPADVQKKMS